MKSTVKSIMTAVCALSIGMSSAFAQNEVYTISEGNPQGLAPTITTYVSVSSGERCYDPATDPVGLANDYPTCCFDEATDDPANRDRYPSCPAVIVDQGSYGVETYDASQTEGVRSLNEITSDIPLADTGACGPECSNLQQVEILKTEPYFGEGGIYAQAEPAVAETVTVTETVTEVAYAPVEMAKPTVALPDAAPAYKAVEIGSTGMGGNALLYAGGAVLIGGGILALVLSQDDDDDAANASKP